MIKGKFLCVVLALGSSALVGCGAPLEADDFSEAEFAEANAAPLEPSSSSAEEASPRLGTAHQALFNLCENVRIEVTNLYEEPGGARPDIKVTAVSFFNADKAKWSKQSVTNEVISYGDYYPYVEDLENVDSDPITKWRVYHRHDLGNGWANEVYEEINTSDVDCRDGMTVELTVDT